jgi:ribosomal protein S18 acetylase RimI-like enzyme
VLLNAALEAARDRGCAEVLLEVASDNPAAVALYHSAGFTVAPPA